MTRRATVRLGSTEPVDVDDLARQVGRSVEEVRQSLDELVAAGFVEPAPDGRYYLTVPVEDPR